MTADPARARADPPLGGGVVGRDLELADVGEFLDANPVRPAALVIEGEAGIGKTTLVRAALEQASAVGLRLFAARPAEGEMELPYAGLGDLLATVSANALAGLPGPQRASIEAALGRADATVEASVLGRGLLEVLRVEGAEGDLLLIVDDVQWLDRPTASALTFALRRSGTIPVRILVARRTENDSRDDLPLGLGDWEDVRRVAVCPLSATALGEVIRHRLGLQLPRPRLEALEHASSGNPMFAIELVRQGYGEANAKPAVSLSSVLADGIRALDADARRAFEFAAASLRPSTDLLLRAGVGREELRSALDTGLIALHGERLVFSHPLLPAVAYDRLLPEARREIHARLAATASDPVERGHHVSRSAVGRDEAAAAVLERAADEAAKLGDHAGAAAFLLRAVGLSAEPHGDAANRRAVEAATELVLAGDVANGAALCRSLIDRLPPGAARARARYTLVYCSTGAGTSYHDCISELELALQDGESDEALRAELHRALSEIFLGMCVLDQAMVHARLAGELAERAGMTGTEVVALALLGFAESMLGLGITDAARQALQRWDGIATGFVETPRMTLACLCIPRLAFDEAQELFEQELAMAQDFGIETVEVVARAHLAEVHVRAGRWDNALTNARDAVEHARQATEPQIVTGTLSVLAMTEALIGQLERARAIAGEALLVADEMDDFWFRISHRAVLGLIAVTEDDAQAAVEALEPAWNLMLERGLGDLSLFPVAQVLGEALVTLGRHDEAAAIAERLNSAPSGAQPWCRAMAWRLEALLASASGDHAGARAAIAATLEIQSVLPEPFEHARSLHIRGKLERSARSWAAARAAFNEALELFDQLGAARWAEKAAADIARLPGRRSGSKTELTTREREVAELAAAGLANKEIAARLYVSLSTVEASLSKVYAKLGVRSRTQLAGRFNRSGGALSA